MSSIEPFSMRAITEEVAQLHGVTVAEIRGPSRVKRLVTPRREAMQRIRALKDEQTGKPRYSFPRIANFFGGRDHTAVVYACRGGRPTSARHGEGA